VFESFSNFWIFFNFLVFFLFHKRFANMGWRNEQQQQRVWRPMGLLLFLSFLLLLFVSVQGFEVKPAGIVSSLRRSKGNGFGFATEHRVKNYVCDTCMRISQKAELLLGNPDTVKETIRVIEEHFCSTLQPGLKTKCEKFIEAYVPEIFLELETELEPDNLCFQSGLCTATAVEAALANKRACKVCQHFAQDALTFLEKNKTREEIIIALHLACSHLQDLSKQCDLLVDLYTPQMIQELDNLTPQEFCELTKLCKLPQLSWKRNDCATCQFVVLEVKLKLQDPKLQARVLDVLLKGCDRVINHVEECKGIVEQYGPFVLENLDEMLDSKAVCCKIGVCQAPCPRIPWAKLSKQSKPIIELPEAKSSEQSKPVIELPLAHLVA
jgi:saposin